MPSNIVLRNLTPKTVKANSAPIIATKAGLRDGSRAGSGGGGGGGGEALSWSAVGGSVDHGADIRILTDGTFNFGTRPHASQLQYQEGDRLWLNGVLQTIQEQSLAHGELVTNSGAYDMSDTGHTADREDVVFPRAGFAYVASADGHPVTAPVGQGGSPAPKTTDRAYISYKSWQSSDIMKLVSTSYESITNGPFIGGNGPEIGEDVIITSSATGNTVGGRITFVDTVNKIISLEKEGFSSTDFQAGCTIQGVQSGAIATGDGVTYLVWAASKRWRFETNAGVPAQARMTVGNNVIIGTDAGEWRPNGSRAAIIAGLRQKVATWEHMAASLVCKDDDTLVGKMRLNGVLDVYGPQPLGKPRSEITAGIGLGPHVSDYAARSPGGHQFRHCNGVYDDYPARVMLGNAASWDQCSKVQDCLIKEWASDSIRIQLNYGDFGAGETVSAFIFDGEDNLINTAGLVLGTVQ
ncbi:hypothetical protein [Marinobacter sp. MDS2]|uniref:hypothetical protein n=1 Tax=Marinobacter sp. MDS2 TaxID=3065961 RepID=UPI00273CD987|nr:hypothetical protein [Marinobacter sp. MDS2]MDP4546497.1 hypothetical protein [Marinobacter sp. MDS2]